MKQIKYKISIYLGLVILFMNSCNLDEVYYSEVTPENYYTSKESILGVFGRPFGHWAWYCQTQRFYVQEYTGDVLCLPTRGTDWDNGGINRRLHHHTWTPDDSYMWEVWRGTGMGMAYAMETKEDLTNVDYAAVGLTEADKADHLMQLQALDAYYYVKGLDFFGGMPIYSSTTDKETGRNTDVETFDHAEKLLKEAIPQIKPKAELGKSEEGKIQQATAASLLAQLYFNAEATINKAMFAECAVLCQDIIDGKYGKYDLDPTWYGPHGFDNNLSPEIIWSSPSEANKQEYNWWYKMFGHYETYKYLDLEVKGNNGACLQPSLNPKGNLYTENKLGTPFAKFHQDDIRKKPYFYKGKKEYEGMFLMGVQKNPKTGAESKGAREYKGKVINLVDQITLMSKLGTTSYPTINDLPSTIKDAEENSGIRPWKVPQPNKEDIAYRYNPDNPIIRLTEIYYMLAECKMRAGDKAGAATLINKVRKRNFENEIDPNPVTASNLDEYRMLDEWMIEFLAEGQGRRRTDLIRWNKFVTEDWWDHKATNDKTRHRFPIPTNALDGNQLLKQNPGY